MSEIIKFYFPNEDLTISIYANLVEPEMWELFESDPFADFEFGDIILGKMNVEDIVIVTDHIAQTKYKTYNFILAKQIIDNILFNKFLSNLPDGVHWEKMMGGFILLHVPISLQYDPNEDLNKVLDKI